MLLNILDSLQDGRLVAVQLLFCGMLLLRLVQASMQHSYVVPIHTHTHIYIYIYILNKN